MKKILLSIVFSTSCIISTNQSFANSSTINSANVIEDTLKGISHCLHYKIVGMCFWFKCSVKGCGVQTTLKLDHTLPDEVVSVYTKPNNNPWDFAKMIVDPAAYRIGELQLQQFDGMNMGFGDEHDNASIDLNNRFHEVDIIGNPALAVLSIYNVLLPSTANPYMPYYSSLLDAQGWRFPGLERFYLGSEIPGLHDIGTIILHDWGSLYPRNGFVNQPDDAKAAAVDALRASTIITAIGQPHLYAPLSNVCGNHCKADAIKENSTVSQYQMIYPKVENQCVVFGGSDAMSVRPWESDAANKGDNRYVWILWRHYHGCVPDKGAKYLGSMNFSN